MPENPLDLEVVCTNSSLNYEGIEVQVAIFLEIQPVEYGGI